VAVLQSMVAVVESLPQYVMHAVPTTMHYILHSLIVSVLFNIFTSIISSTFEGSMLFILLSSACTAVSIWLMLLTCYMAWLLPSWLMRTFRKASRSVAPISSISNAIDSNAIESSLSMDLSSEHKPTTMHSPTSKVVMVRHHMNHNRLESNKNTIQSGIHHSYLDDSDEEHYDSDLNKVAIITRDIKTTSLYELSDDEESKSSADSLHKYVRESSSTTLLPIYFDEDIVENVANNGHHGLHDLYDLFMGQDDEEDAYRILR